METARQLPLPDAFALAEYWQEFPPPHVSLQILLRSFTNWQPTQGARKQEMTQQDAGNLQMLAAGTVKTFDNLPVAVQDWLNNMPKGKPN